VLGNPWNGVLPPNCASKFTFCASSEIFALACGSKSAREMFLSCSLCAACKMAICAVGFCLSASPTACTSVTRRPRVGPCEDTDTHQWHTTQRATQHHTSSEKHN